MIASLAILVSFTFLLFPAVNCIDNCIECLVVTVGAPEQVGGPTNSDYDSPTTAIIVNDPSSKTYQQRQYSANSNSYLIYNNSSFLSNPVEIGVNKGTDKSDLDYCGAWLNSAINNLKNDSSNIVHGFYHEEWNCDYADNSYTNKSIAYAVSTDGGLHFTKPNYPHNQIILPPPGNTTTVHQTGEGDHEIAVINDNTLYLYFTEWDGPYNTVTIGLATSTQNGLPGTWYKYLNGKFSSPGLGGDSSAIAGVPGTCVRYRKEYDDFIALGSRGNDNNVMGYGPRLSFSNDGINGWTGMSSSLLWVDQDSWNRNPPVGELVAYSTLTSQDIVMDGGTYNFVYNMSYWLYYTYLEPNGTFGDRYNVRRKVDIKQYDNGIPSDVPQVRVMLSYYYNDQVQDSWFTTAMVPDQDGYKDMDNGDVIGMLMTKDVGNGDTTKIYDCYNPSVRDHMIGFENECVVTLRTLGWIFENEINNEYVATQAIYRCYDAAQYNHFLSLDSDCDNEGNLEFKMGYIIKP